MIAIMDKLSDRSEKDINIDFDVKILCVNFFYHDIVIVVKDFYLCRYGDSPYVYVNCILL